MSYVSAGAFSSSYNFFYDGNGNIVHVKQNGNKNTYYHYDSANQLIREDNQAAGKTWVWTYDDAGNILSKKEYAYTTGTLGSATSTITYGYGNAEWGDLLTAYNGKSFSYDTIGNLTSDGTWNYTWSQGRQLATMSKSGTTWTFTYDANGMRTKRTTGSTSTTYNYTYNGSQLTHMTYGSNSLHFYYDASGKPLSVVYNGTTYYYILSLQGDVVAILNSSGVSVVEYTYDAWGRLLTTTGSMAPSLGLNNPLRYRSYIYDRETGLYYLQSRYYNPEIGRFISTDSISYLGADGTIQSYNLFAYCNNNPVNYTDASGKSAVTSTSWLLPLLALLDGATPFLEFVALCIVGAAVITRYIEKEKAESIAIADSIVSTGEQQAVYYGADIIGDLTGKKEWRLRTGPMDYETAIGWVYATAASETYGKNASWGLYTSNQDDASDMAVALGGIGPCLHENRINEYPHFHVLGMLLFGKYKHFHIWYGSMYEE